MNGGVIIVVVFSVNSGAWFDVLATGDVKSSATICISSAVVSRILCVSSTMVLLSRIVVVSYDLVVWSH